MLWLQPQEQVDVFNAVLDEARVGVTARRLWRTWGAFDLCKSRQETPDRGPIIGDATTEDKDADGEIIVQAGIDWTPCRWVTLEHPLGVTNIIGEPINFNLGTSAKTGSPATQMDADLFLDRPMAAETYQTAKTIKKTKAKNRLGFSIEGDALEADAKNPKRITKAVAYSVAVSPYPKNPFSQWEPIYASLAGAVGYPTQGVPAVGGFSVAVPQAGVFGTVNGLAKRDLDVLHVLKHLPELTYNQGCEVYDAIVAMVTRRKRKKERT